MSKLRRKNGNKELSALARLNDREIDTSDIPEVKDWSRAIVGRFYRSGEQRIAPLPPKAGTFAENLVGELGTANTQSASATGITEVTSGEVVKACIKGIPEAWPEFIRRFQRLIATVVMRTSRGWGVQSSEHIDDLVQEVYVRLCTDDYRLLRTYQGDYTSSFYSYLRVIANNVVHDQFRRRLAARRGGDKIGDLLIESNEALATDAESATSLQEKEVFFEEVDRILQTTASEDERVIFWLYYREGFTASEIAAVPTSNLTEKGVESLLHRLLRRIRSELTKQNQRPS